MNIKLVAIGMTIFYPVRIIVAESDIQHLFDVFDVFEVFEVFDVFDW